MWSNSVNAFCWYVKYIDSTWTKIVKNLLFLALYGTIFSEESEAAFSNYRMWESLGFIIAFAYSTALCTNYKTYILTIVLVIGVVGYYVVEFLVYKKRTAKVGDAEINGGSELTIKKGQEEEEKPDIMTNGTS